ncbi:hypothetical protein I551_6069 [Mycobacterium ulcerans str. Harvey]|uniref:Uncharacterized protein n=1 Tax=Mycobacterium ulcerans str. Harvey TaxID=1299332 RepID=A0ABP3A7M2_MYCUL|nr:hypothetical protein I551_6069 [Mycobacterium ulcerans str. Harvey]
MPSRFGTTAEALICPAGLAPGLRIGTKIAMFSNLLQYGRQLPPRAAPDQ